MRKGRRNDGKRLWYLFVSSLATTSFVAIVIYGQGRMYRQGLIEFFGLSSTQFPMETYEVFWLALLGWLNGTVRVMDGLLEIFTRLVETGTKVFLISFCGLVPMVYILRRKQNASDETNGVLSRAISWLGAGMREGGVVKTIFSCMAFTGLSSAAMVVSVFAFVAIISFVVGTVFTIFLAPFYQLGRDAGSAFCRNENGEAQEIIERSSGVDNVAILIECNNDYCAVVKNGSVEVIDSGSLVRIKVPSEKDRVPRPVCGVDSGPK